MGLGVRPGENITIFAETSRFWLHFSFFFLVPRFIFKKRITAAHAAFRNSIPLVTVYATLGEEAILHTLNESDSSILLTDASLLPILAKIIPVRLPIPFSSFFLKYKIVFRSSRPNRFQPSFTMERMMLKF